MPDERGGSWPSLVAQAPAQRVMPNQLRRLQVPRQELKEAFGTPWREAVRAIVNGGGGDDDALAAASGYTLFGDTAAILLEHEAPNDYIVVVESVIFRPVSDLGFEFLTIALVDGGDANATNARSGRVGDVVRLDLPLPIDGSGVLPVWYQAAGGTFLRLWCSNSDTEAPHAVEAEMRGMTYQAEQFRVKAPRGPGR